MINWFLHSWFYSSHCISMSFIWVIFSKIKEIMNLNRCIIFSFEKSVIIKSMIMVNYVPFLPNYWPWSLWKVLFTRFYISDRLLGCQEQPLLEKYMHKIWICLLACLLWTQSACGSHIHSCDKTWKKGTYDLIYKNPYFFVIIWPNQMGSSLNCRKIVIVS